MRRRVKHLTVNPFTPEFLKWILPSLNVDVTSHVIWTCTVIWYRSWAVEMKGLTLIICDRVQRTAKPSGIANFFYRIYPKYSDTSAPYHTCSKIWKKSTIYFVETTFVSTIDKVTQKEVSSINKRAMQFWQFIIITSHIQMCQTPFSVVVNH